MSIFFLQKTNEISIEREAANEKPVSYWRRIKRQKLNTMKGPVLDPWKDAMGKWESSNEVCSLVNSIGLWVFWFW